MADKEVVLNRFRVSNDFKTDSEYKGKKAEEDFINFFHSRPQNKNKTLFDVRNINTYRNIDVDFVIDNQGNPNLPDFDSVMSNPDRFVKIEVKYNGPALSKGRINFEVISHSKRGWGVLSHCDYMYFVLGNGRDDNKYSVEKRALVNFKLWNDFVRDKNNRVDVFKNFDENTVINFMCYINDLVKKNILIFL
jgi:hypothetical protein